jgi:hypothetical protein
MREFFSGYPSTVDYIGQELGVVLLALLVADYRDSNCIYPVGNSEQNETAKGYTGRQDEHHQKSEQYTDGEAVAKPWPDEVAHPHKSCALHLLGAVGWLVLYARPAGGTDFDRIENLGSACFAIWHFNQSFRFLPTIPARRARSGVFVPKIFIVSVIVMSAPTTTVAVVPGTSWVVFRLAKLVTVLPASYLLDV